MIKIFEWKKLSNKSKEKLLKRAQADVEKLLPQVQTWINKVKKDGDKAILKCTKQFDDKNFKISQIKVSQKEIKEAYEKIDKEVLKAIKMQIKISEAFHKEQARRILKDSKWEIETTKGVRTGCKKTPLESVGLWVPAGKAPLPTVAQILTVAAKAAGVKRIYIAFPPTGKHYEIIVAADLAGATDIFRASGTTAIAAFAYGTKTIPRVDKIAGPGNPFVQATKLAVFGQVGIDMLSGPSEALIIADENAKAEYIAADLLARAEHGPDSAAVLATNSIELAEKVQLEVKKQYESISRKDFAKQALDNGFSAILIFDNKKELVDFANQYAAEHLEIQMQNAEKVADKINNAGSIFIGDYAPVAIGDYASGTNHSLPTSRAVRFSSPIGVETFLKTVEYQILTKEGLKNLWPIIDKIADVEGLDAHKKSVSIRIKNEI